VPLTIARPNRYSQPNGRGRPMGEMNVAPFIDVLLVLIIMLILVIPISTHTTEVDLPGTPTKPIEVAENTVFIDPQDRLF
jgi:biopolymer transport protein ExbD